MAVVSWKTGAKKLSPAGKPELLLSTRQRIADEYFQLTCYLLEKNNQIPRKCQPKSLENSKANKTSQRPPCVRVVAIELIQQNPYPSVVLP